MNPAASTNPADSSNSKASSNPATKNRTRVPIRNISKTLFDKPITNVPDLNRSSLDLEIEKFLDFKKVINDATISEIDEFGAVYLFKNYGNPFPILTQIALCFFFAKYKNYIVNSMINDWVIKLPTDNIRR